MAIGPDRVQVLKQESAALGGDNADDLPFEVPIEAQEDAIECAGIYFQDATNRDEAVYVERHGNDLRLRDVANPVPVTLTTLLSGGALPPATLVGQVLFSTDGASFTVECPMIGDETGWLINDNGILLVTG